MEVCEANLDYRPSTLEVKGLVQKPSYPVSRAQLLHLPQQPNHTLPPCRHTQEKEKKRKEPRFSKVFFPSKEGKERKGGIDDEIPDSNKNGKKER